MEFMKTKIFESKYEMGKTYNGKVMSYPTPFEDITKFPERVDVLNAYNGVMMRPSAVKAMLIRAGYLPVEKAIVAVKDSTTAPAVVCVEYQEEPTDDTVVFRWENSPGGDQAFKGFVFTMAGPQPYTIHACTGTDSTAIWLGMIQAFLVCHPDGPLLESYLDDLAQNMALQAHDDAWEDCAKCIYLVYKALTGAPRGGKPTYTKLLGSNWGSKDDACAPLGVDEIELEDADVITICGEPKLLGSAKATSKVAEEVFIPNDPKEVRKELRKFMVRKPKDYAPWEKAMIPQVNPKYEEDQVDVDIINEMRRTWGKDPDLQVKNFAFFGPAGSGKSARARHAAEILGVPFGVHMCSYGDDELSAFGIIVPVVEGMASRLSGQAKAIYEVLEASGDRIDLEKVAEAIGFPTPEICMLDPESAFEMMGLTDDGTPIMDQRRKALEQKVVSVTNGKSSENGLSYKYIPSPLVIAIEHGHMVALEEPTNVLNQGIFSCLYDVLDRNSDGTIRTPIGVIKRHPDFICMLSSNTTYTGNRDLPGPFKSRFQYLVHLEEPDELTLAKRVQKKLGAKDEDMGTITQCVIAYKAANQRAKDIGQSADFEATPRALFCFADAVLDGGDPKKAFKTYVLPHLANEEEDIQTIWKAVKECQIFL